MVAALRAQRQLDQQLNQRVLAIKAFQHQRFKQTYADLLDQPQYARAVQFFLTELYGPVDFSVRDQQFARVVPALVRLFPADIVQTVAVLSSLHALSEQLDSEMAQVIGHEPICSHSYALAWRTVGKPQAREAQISYTLQVGLALERFTRKPLLRQSLRLMRLPASKAGLGALQSFLETGFDTFRDLRGSGYFLQTIAERERKMASELFAAAGAGS
jgi:hypothetical protein